jgi:hypothetical protein
MHRQSLITTQQALQRLNAYFRSYAHRRNPANPNTLCTAPRKLANQLQVVPPRTTSATHSVRNARTQHTYRSLNYSHLRCCGVGAPVSLPLAALRSLAPCRADKASTWPAPQVRTHLLIYLCPRRHARHSESCSYATVEAVRANCTVQAAKKRRSMGTCVVHCHRKAPSGVPATSRKAAILQLWHEAVQKV